MMYGCEGETEEVMNAQSDGSGVARLPSSPVIDHRNTHALWGEEVIRSVTCEMLRDAS